jgi:alkylation response protein AidB-like acyl-CoA dehydrogenase
MTQIQDQQEVMAGLADMIIEIFAMESAVLRAVKLTDASGESAAAHATSMARVYVAGAMDKLEAAAKKVLAACAEGDALRTQMVILRRLFKYEPINTIGLRQQIAARIIEAGKYVV